MQTIFLTQIFQSPILIESIFKHNLDKIESGDGGFRVIFPESALSTEEQSVFSGFCNLLNAKPTNAGIATYDSLNSLKYFSSPVVGINSDRQLGVLIGVENQHAGHKAEFIPLVYREGKIDENGEKDEGSYAFKIRNENGDFKFVKATLVTIPPKMGENPKSYVAIKNKDFIFHIPFKCEKEIQSGTILRAWEEGEFDSVCLPFFKSSASFNKMFGGLFKNQLFPSGGVVLILKNGKIKINEYQGQSLVSTHWQLVESSHPDLIVTGLKNDPVRLKDIGMIFASQSCLMTKQIIANSEENKVFVVYVYAPNARNPLKFDWVPSHTGVTNPKYLPQVVKNKFPEIFNKAEVLHNGSLPVYREATEEECEMLDSFDYPAIEPSQKTIDIAYESINGDKPKSAIGVM